MTIVSDTHLAYLLSLGFDIELCKQALKQNSSLESATNWILNPEHPPTLNLGLDLTQPHSSGSQLSYTTSASSSKVKENEELKLHQKKQFEKMSNDLKKDKLLEKEARQRALLEIKEDQEKRKAKGLLNTTHTPQQQQQQILTEREKIQQRIKREKQLDREQRQRILQNIKNDQKDKKSKTASVSSTTPKATTVSSNTSEAFIQFKLANGSSLRQKFIATTKVSEIFDFVLAKEIELNQEVTIDKLSLVCGFPRRTFTALDGELDMKEAGFLPNVSLNVIVQKPEPVVVQEEQPVVEEHNSANESNSMDLDSEDDEDDEDDEEDEMFGMLNPAFTSLNRRRRPVARGPVTSGGHRLGDGPATESTTHVEAEDTVMEDANRRTHILSALENRTLSDSKDKTNNEKSSRVGKKRYVKTLKDICSGQVSVLLSQHTVAANKYLQKLVYTSSDVAEFLFTCLIKSGQLNVSTLRKLADHCYLQHIVLDSYSYCTDSLIEDLCKTNSSISITKLSLRGCDVITDGAIRALEGLKNLMYLDLNNCKVTDKGLQSLEKLPHLAYLNLGKTKISNKGLDSLLSNAKFKGELQVLLLDGCTRINSCGILVPIVNEFTNLVQLSYAYTTTTYVPQEKETKLTNKQVRLEQLDINHTSVEDQELINTVSRFKNLVELKLGGCDLLSTRSLSFLPRELKHLEYIQFPNREHELDGVLSRYKDLPLKHLDLTGFLNVTDEGVKSISCMQDLRSLSLIGTKVTDEGIMYLKDLIELEELSLDRTLVTDIGLETLTGLSKLETLSLCRTGVSNDGLCMIGDFEQTSFARNLRSLNLSQCALVTDKGVRGISGMANLTNLNLDHTGVSKSCIKYLKDLEHLNPVRLQGVEKEEDDTMDME